MQNVNKSNNAKVATQVAVTTVTNAQAKMQMRIAQVQQLRKSKNAARALAAQQANAAQQNLLAYNNAMLQLQHVQQMQVAQLQATYNQHAQAVRVQHTAHHSAPASAPKTNGKCNAIWVITAQCGYARKQAIAACLATGANSYTVNKQVGLCIAHHAKSIN